jgi:hypothetical protein
VVSRGLGRAELFFKGGNGKLQTASTNVLASLNQRGTAIRVKGGLCLHKAYPN